MTQPRYIVPVATYLVTRRCAGRAFRLRPSKRTTRILAYCLALALHKTGVVLHAACFMSDHHHLVVTDVRGRLPDFLRELHRLTAKALNASQGEWGNLWAGEHCNVVRLVDVFDVIDKIAYVAANPVAAGLVHQPGEWPGLSLWTECAFRVQRPIEFGPRSRAPEELTLRVESPPMVGTGDAPVRWTRRVQAALAEKVASAHQALRKACRKVLGRAAVLAESFLKRASSTEPRRVRIPTCAAKDPKSFFAMLAVQRAFRAAYHAAVDAWKAGDREVTFPYGTWWMRLHHGARCASPPAAAA